MTSGAFAERYPNIDAFVTGYGWIEVGYIEHTQSFIRALNEGGWVWEGKHTYDSLDDAWADLEQGLADWMKEVTGNYGE